MKLGGMLHNGKPQAGAAHLLGMALVHPIKPLKHPFLLMNGNADTGIRYGKYRSVFLILYRHGNAAASHIIFDGVIANIVQDLMNRISDMLLFFFRQL